MTTDNPDSSDHNSNGSDKPSANHHDIALAIEALRKNYETAQSERTKHDGKTLFWGRFAGIGAGVYVLLTVIIAGGSIFAAIYSGQQAAATREANSQVQRPFVTFTGLQITQQNLIVPSMPYLWITVLAQNSGNTPTRGMQYVFQTGSEAKDPEITYQGTLGGSRWRITLPPHFNGSLGFPAAGLPLSAFKEQVAHHAWYFVWGETRYGDRFSNSQEHISKFCYAIGASINDSSVPAYEPCRFWNCADEDCDTDEAKYQAEQHKRPK